MRKRKRNWRNGKRHIDMELLELTELQRVLEDFATDIRDRYRDVLANNDHIASRKLVDSIKTQVVIGDNYYDVTMTLEDYWKYVEYDTPPHFPPLNKILEWIQIKPIIPRPDDNGRIPSPKQLAFLIGRAMAGKSPNQEKLKNPNGGTTGTHDLAQTKEDILPWWREQISQALGHDMENYIRKLVRE